MVKEMGTRIVVIKDGSWDAQQRTVQGFSNEGYIDFLAATNCFRLVKTGGLLPRVLERLNVSPGDMACFGGHEQQGMKPALAEGMFSIHLAVVKQVFLNTIPPQINTLRRLRYILSNDDRLSFY